VTSNDLPVSVYQDWRIETEGLDAFGDRPPLRPIVLPRIMRIRDEIGDRDEF